MPDHLCLNSGCLKGFSPDRVDAASPWARILIVNWRCPKNPRRGGAEVHLHQIAKRLVALGHPVVVLTNQYRSAAPADQMDGVIYRRIGGEISFLWRHREGLRGLCDAGRFDLVIDDISKLPLAVQHAVTVPTIAWCHHIHGQSLYRQLAPPLAWMVDHWERGIAHWYAETPMLAVSESTRQELIALGLAPQRIGYVRNAVDVSAIERDEATEADDPLLLYLGRLQRYKNVDCVLRAFSRIRSVRPDAELAIVGQGPDEPRLRRLARRLCPTGVSFHGYVNERRKHVLLHRAWLSLASSSKEGWGICVLEANAAGTPVIGSDVPGHRDAIIHGKTGLLYPFDDDRALANAALQCIGDYDQRRRLGRHARQWAERFNWDGSVQELLRWIAHFYPRLRSRLAIRDEPIEFSPENPKPAPAARKSRQTVAALS